MHFLDEEEKKNAHLLAMTVIITSYFLLRLRYEKKSYTFNILYLVPPEFNL